MLTSNPSNQYLRPDYLQPLPNTLDAKNSPLALLAQTCSAIGAETPNPKLLANMEKSAKSTSKESRDKTSPVNCTLTAIQPVEGPPKSSFKPYEMVSSHQQQQEERAASAHRIKTPTTNGRDSNRSATSSPSQGGRQRTPVTTSPLRSLAQTPPDKTSSSASPQNRASSKDTSSPAMMTPNTNHNNNHVPVSLSIANLSRSEPSQKPLAISPPSSSSSSSTPSSASSYFSGFTSPALPPPYALELMAQHMKAVTLNPYLNYARQMKAPGADAMMSVCRDPYCQGCALSPAQMKGPCPAGCMQCDHHNPHHAAGKAAAAAAYPQQMAAAYAQAQLAAFAAASQLPYICNWIGGGGGVESSYCGKRFGTSDELLQHLRTHTASMAADPMMNPHLFQRTYPTPPLSPLSSARYHPYSKPSFLPASLAGLPPPPPPHLAQYFSPYSLYASRLGTPPTMPP